MKKTLTIITLLAGAVSGYSQGQIIFNVYQTSDRQAIYNTQAGSAYAVTYGGYTVMETVGSSPTTLTTAESPAGTTAYAVGSALSGTGYSAELLIGPAGITSLTGTAQGLGLLPFGGTNSTGGVVANFYTGNARHIGFINAGGTIALPTASYYANGATVSVAVAAWNNEGGTVTTLAAAQEAKDPWGISPVAQVAGLTTGASPGATLAGLESFSLGTSTPEPSTIALGVMGASALLFRRRK
jgi:hypothetical protein